MEYLTPTQIWMAVLAVASAVVLLSNAAKAIAQAWQAAKAPNAKQDARIKSLEDWREEVNGKLAADHKRFEEQGRDNRVTMRALLALLDHGLDGNNITQMQHAKEELQDRLIEK